MIEPPNTLIAQHILAAQTAAETALQTLAPAEGTKPVRLHDAMRHSLLAPGKRVRPILTLLSAEQFGVPQTRVMTAACAIEMIHAASLILDDLPAMDDATLRRGRPTSHAMFGDDTAMLASIGLMNLAYDVVARDTSLEPAHAVRIVAALSRSIGSQGLVAGQEEDLHGLPSDSDTADALETMHRRKTGALFAAAAEIGAIASDQPAETCDELYEFGMRLGHAFQTLDDLLDFAGSIELAGKDVANDSDKPTLVQMLGFDAARTAAMSQVDAALAVLPGGASSLLGLYAQSLTEMLVLRLDA